MNIVIKFFIALLLSQNGLAGSVKLYKKIFPDYTNVKEIKVEDPISDNPINTIILKVYNNNKLIGFIREISTTTGCNSACLPVIYTAFYNESGHFLKILSRDGLTKIGHAPFNRDDDAKLELVLAMAPKEFGRIKHPKELTDAITGATIKGYQNIVVTGAAYSTLRIHLYNQLTIKQIKTILNRPI